MSRREDRVLMVAPTITKVINPRRGALIAKYVSTEHLNKPQLNSIRLLSTPITHVHFSLDWCMWLYWYIPTLDSCLFVMHLTRAAYTIAITSNSRNVRYCYVSRDSIQLPRPPSPSIGKGWRNTCQFESCIVAIWLLTIWLEQSWRAHSLNRNCNVKRFVDTSIQTALSTSIEIPIVPVRAIWFIAQF